MNSLLWGRVKSSKVFLSMKEHYFVGKLQESKILSRSGKKMQSPLGLYTTKVPSYQWCIVYPPPGNRLAAAPHLPRINGKSFVGEETVGKISNYHWAANIMHKVQQHFTNTITMIMTHLTLRTWLNQIKFNPPQCSIHEHMPWRLLFVNLPLSSSCSISHQDFASLQIAPVASCCSEALQFRGLQRSQINILLIAALKVAF